MPRSAIRKSANNSTDTPAYPDAVRLSWLLRVLAVALLLAVGILTGGTTATAADSRWSGLDARGYDGPIPAPGGLITTT